MINISLEKLLDDNNEYFELSLEARELIDVKSQENTKSLYVLLIDSGSDFSKLAKFVTGKPYAHASITTDQTLNTFYSYDMNPSVSGKLTGGLVVENVNDLVNSKFSLYKVDLSEKIFKEVDAKIKSYVESKVNTSYNHLGLINAVFNTKLFNSDKETMFCSQFVAEVLRFSGIGLFKARHSSLIKPDDIIRSRMLQFVKRGKIKKNRHLLGK